MVRRDIQGLRAFAVTAVVVHHFWPHFLPGGFVGVDVFLVISGFLITQHLVRQPPVSGKLLTDFWARRVRRLIPVASLVLLVSLVATVLWMPPTVLDRSAIHVAAAALYGVNWTIAAERAFPQLSGEPPTLVKHFWSLSVEEQFYFLWPLLIAVVVLLGRKFAPHGRHYLLLGVVMGSVVAGSLAASITLTAQDTYLAYYFTHSRLWELGVGGLLALLLRVRDSRPLLPWVLLRWASAWLGVGICWASAFLFAAGMRFPGLTALVPCLGALLVIAADADEDVGSPGVLWSNRPVQWVGDVSYSLYVWHWPVVVVLPFIVGQANFSGLIKLAGLVAVVVAAGLTYRWVENPLRYNRFLINNKPASFALGVVCMFTVVLACVALLASQPN